MIESVGTIVINTSPDEVFRFLAHRENFPQWASAGSGVRVVILSEGSFGDGTLIQHTQVVSRVSHLQVNQGFETDTIRIHFPSRLLISHMHDLFQFEPVGQGTQVTLKVQIEPVFPGSGNDDSGRLGGARAAQPSPMAGIHAPVLAFVMACVKCVGVIRGLNGFIG
jgi:hypothetical protein